MRKSPHYLSSHHVQACKSGNRTVIPILGCLFTLPSEFLYHYRSLHYQTNTLLSLSLSLSPPHLQVSLLFSSLLFFLLLVCFACILCGDFTPIDLRCFLFIMRFVFVIFEFFFNKFNYLSLISLCSSSSRFSEDFTFYWDFFSSIGVVNNDFWSEWWVFSFKFFIVCMHHWLGFWLDASFVWIWFF